MKQYTIRPLVWDKTKPVWTAEGITHNYTVQMDENRIKLFATRPNECQKVFDFKHYQDVMDDAERHNRLHATKLLREV
ncbi:hypothetical protein [Faucicola boevrei]|uniref:hypothetical protein n=1 Tax=Faucicola boevrei TaxID=346665 RepID=UPI00038172F9|nr:hypothetical protein [Moraxella boevrei]